MIAAIITGIWLTDETRRGSSFRRQAVDEDGDQDGWRIRSIGRSGSFHPKFSGNRLLIEAASRL
jgi:hypothetical protein